MNVPLLFHETIWECPNCTGRHRTTVQEPHTPFHPCPGLAGILAPYVQAGTNVRVRVRALAREDYVGGEQGLRYDQDGTPVMSVITDRWDGSYDTAVFAPTATARERHG